LKETGRGMERQRGRESLGGSGGDGVVTIKLTCKRGSVGQREGLSIPRSSVRFRLKPDDSNSHGFELNRPSNKGITLLLKVIKAIIIIIMDTHIDTYSHSRSYIDAGTSIYAHTDVRHLCLLQLTC